MKRKILPLVIAATAAGSYAGVALADAPTVYGKINVSINKVDQEAENGDTIQDNWDMISNASRLGVKGDLTINDSLKAIYKLEYEVITDEDKAGDGGSDFKQRNTYVGLQGNFGTVLAGRHDTPTKLAQGKIDEFNDLHFGDLKYIFEGENRANEVLAYISPEMSGFSVAVAVIPGQSSGMDGDTTDNENNGLADHLSASVTFKQDGLYVAVATDQDVDSQDLLRVVGQYDFGTFKIGAMWQDTESTDKAFYGDFEESGYMVSGEVKVSDNVVLKAQYGDNERKENGSTSNQWTQMSVGADYKLSSASKVYAYYSDIQDDEATGATLETQSTFGAGIEVKF